LVGLCGVGEESLGGKEKYFYAGLKRALGGMTGSQKGGNNPPHEGPYINYIEDL
jgi:hypothetical protein